MSIDVGMPSAAAVADAQESGVSDKASEGSARADLALLCLIEVLWIAALAYGAFEVQGLVRGLI